MAILAERYGADKRRVTRIIMVNGAGLRQLLGNRLGVPGSGKIERKEEPPGVAAGRVVRASALRYLRRSF